MSIGGLDRTRSVSESVRSPVQTDRAGPKSEEKPERSLAVVKSVHSVECVCYVACYITDV